MRRALTEYDVGGIKTTLPFFREVMEDEVFKSGKIDTGFISKFFDRRSQKQENGAEKDLAIVAAALADIDSRKTTETNAPDNRPSRWALATRPSR